MRPWCWSASNSIGLLVNYGISNTIVLEIPEFTTKTANWCLTYCTQCRTRHVTWSCAHERNLIIFCHFMWFTKSYLLRRACSDRSSWAWHTWPRCRCWSAQCQHCRFLDVGVIKSSMVIFSLGVSIVLVDNNLPVTAPRKNWRNFSIRFLAVHEMQTAHSSVWP